MQMDVRGPMGGMFTVLGGTLSLFGLFSASDHDLYARSLGINVNLWWGLVVLAFGLFMLLLSWRSSRTASANPPRRDEPEPLP